MPYVPAPTFIPPTPTTTLNDAVLKVERKAAMFHDPDQWKTENFEAIVEYLTQVRLNACGLKTATVTHRSTGFSTLPTSNTTKFRASVRVGDTVHDACQEVSHDILHDIYNSHVDILSVAEDIADGLAKKLVSEVTQPEPTLTPEFMEQYKKLVESNELVAPPRPPPKRRRKGRFELLRFKP